MTAEARLRAEAQTPGLAALLCAAFPYANGREPELPLSRYARGKDYHLVLRERMERASEVLRARYPGKRFDFYADVSPFPEVWAAARAGLGKLGQNGLLLTERAGSWVFLGFLATDAPIPGTEQEIVSCCGCGLCRRQCPGQALALPFREERCLSAISQRRGALTPEEQTLLRENAILWGCDRCQTVCPENRRASAQPLPEFMPLSLPEPGDFQQGDRAFRRAFRERAFTWRGVQPLRRNADLLAPREAQPSEKDK